MVEDFPWTYDQYQRYAVVEEYLKVFYPEKEVSVLDVGGVSPTHVSASLWTPISYVSPGIAHILDTSFFKGEHFTQGDGIHLPYKDESFDVITALDVIEHVPAKKREMFVAELLRVAKHSILFSAPFQSPSIEQAEEALFSQIKTIFDAEHQQLLEHKTLGLPEDSTMEEILENLAPTHTSFSFGSLTNWLFFQSLKNIFLFGKNTKEILGLIDRWQASNNSSSEWVPPFARHFWIGSKDLTQNNLKEGLDRLVGTLRHKKDTQPAFEEMLEFNRDIIQAASPAKVSALVISWGEGEHLIECLNHLSTQIVNFNFEIAVCDIKKEMSKKESIRSHFPGVKFISNEENESLTAIFYRALDKLRGDYILLLSDDILLHQDAVDKLHHTATLSPDRHVFFPRIEWKKRDFFYWGQRKLFLKNRRLIIKAFEKTKAFSYGNFKEDKAQWVYNECFFSHRSSFFHRDFVGQKLSSRNLFLWKNRKPDSIFRYTPEVVVFKQG